MPRTITGFTGTGSSVDGFTSARGQWTIDDDDAVTSNGAFRGLLLADASTDAADSKATVTIAPRKDMLISSMVFAVIRPLVHGGRRRRIAVGGLVALAGIGFIVYPSQHSTGSVAAQLGIAGIAMFVALFGALVCATWRLRDPRARLAGAALTVAFIVNAAFNDVALSPNSAATSFVLVGLLVARAASPLVRDRWIETITSARSRERT